MAKANMPVLYRWFKAYVRFLTEKIYYKKVYYLNTENVPEDGTPLLVVSDHQNAMNDALGVLLSIRDRLVHLIPDFGNDSPYLFTPMYEASFKGTKR